MWQRHAKQPRNIKDVTRASDIISSISLLFRRELLQRELVDVNELVREWLSLLRSEANRYSISIRTELADDLPKVMADRVQLQQVFHEPHAQRHRCYEGNDWWR